VKIFVAEQETEVAAGTRLFQLRDQLKPDADVLVYNGAPGGKDLELVDGDRVVFIKRGEVPSKEELENLIVARHTPGVHQKVKVATIGVAGLGGLGSAVAIALARVGVGKLVLADFDIVEPSNLNRQQYFVDQLGFPKSQALADNLKRINPYVSIESHALKLTPENVPEIFADVEILVEAFDRDDQKVMLMESFAVAFPKRPIVMASGLAGHGPAGSIAVRRLGESIFIVGDLESAAQPGCGLMAPRVGVAAHTQANVVLRLLLGEYVS
jgi:sulfur carrier protein ThiS adenylyltransferase